MSDDALRAAREEARQITGDISESLQALSKRIEDLEFRLRDCQRIAESYKAEALRLRKQVEAYELGEEPLVRQVSEENELLREALDNLGNALAQIQPAIDPQCGWALDIIPAAEAEIAELLKRDQR